MNSLEEAEEMVWKCHACRYHFVAKRRLIKKLEGLLQNQVTASQFFIKLAFLKALTIMKDSTDNTEFNKRRSRIEATQNCAME